MPAFSRSPAIIVVVVVLPSEPVTAYVLHGQRSKKHSISDVITTEGNIVAVSTVLSTELGMDPESVNAVVSLLEKLVIAIDGLDIPGKLAPVTDAIGGLVA